MDEIIKQTDNHDGSLESKGLHHYERIDRNNFCYDNRTKFVSDTKEFDRNMLERKSVNSKKHQYVVGSIVIEEDIPLSHEQL